MDSEEFIKKNYPPVEGKPGYVWFSRRNYQIISIDTLKEAFKKYDLSQLSQESLESLYKEGKRWDS